MILGYVDTIEQNITDFNSDFQIWKLNNTPYYSADKWSNVYSQSGSTNEYAILYNDDMVNIVNYDSNKVKDISHWDCFNDEILL